MPNNVELAVAAIWSEILGVENPGPSASFYEYGGTSLLAVLIAMRIQEELGATIDVADILRDHELHDLIRTVKTRLGS
jgi:acyl carrier protein